MAKKSCIQPSYTSSNEFLYNMIYKLTVGHPKTRLEIIKNVIDSLASDYKEIEAFSVVSNIVTYCRFTWEKKKIP